MKVVNPDLATNTIKLIPRNNDLTPFNITLINETTKEVTELVLTAYTYVYGVLSFDLTFDFNEGDKYEFKCWISFFGGSEVVYYRGKIFATTQIPQNYELSKDLYIYE